MLWQIASIRYDYYGVINDVYKSFTKTLPNLVYKWLTSVYFYSPLNPKVEPFINELTFLGRIIKGQFHHNGKSKTFRKFSYNWQTFKSNFSTLPKSVKIHFTSTAVSQDNFENSWLIKRQLFKIIVQQTYIII